MMVCKVQVHRLPQAFLNMTNADYSLDCSYQLSDDNPASASPAKLYVNSKKELKACPLSKKWLFHASSQDGCSENRENLAELLRKCQRCRVLLVDCMKRIVPRPDSQSMLLKFTRSDEENVTKSHKKQKKKEKEREKHKVFISAVKRIKFMLSQSHSFCSFFQKKSDDVVEERSHKKAKTSKERRAILLDQSSDEETGPPCSEKNHKDREKYADHRARRADLVRMIFRLQLSYNRVGIV